MKYSISLLSTVRALLTVIGLNVLLLIILFSLGRYFHILPSFTWFGYKVIVFPFSIIIFIFSMLSEIKVKEKRTVVSKVDEEIESKSRMEKYHDS